MSHIDTLRRNPKARLFALPVRVAVPAACVVAATVIACTGMSQAAAEEAKPLAYVGTLAFGKPAVEEARIVVPLRYEGGAWHKNSSIVPIRVASKVNGRDVDITVIAGVSRNGRDHSGYELALPAGLKGKFTFFYCDPDGTRHALDQIVLGE